MLSVSWTQQRHGDVTLVGVVLTADGSTPRRGRLTVRLDGPIWPPRRRGVREAGWTDETFETVVPPGDQVAVGFASPASPADPPVELVADDRASADEGASTGSMTRLEGNGHPEAIVRSLGDARPPRDAVPVGVTDGCSVERENAAGAGRREHYDEPVQHPPAEPCEEPAQTPTVADTQTQFTADTCDERNSGVDVPTATRQFDRSTAEPAVVPAPVRAWLADVETRVEHADAIGAATQITVAARAIEDAGGLSGVESLHCSLQSDAERLRSIADRASVLADRCEASADSVPLDALRRLA